METSLTTRRQPFCFRFGTAPSQDFHPHARGRGALRGTRLQPKGTFFLQPRPQGLLEIQNALRPQSVRRFSRTLPCFARLTMTKAGDTLGNFIRRSRRYWSPAKIASEFRRCLMRAHLAIFFADRGDLPLHFVRSQAPSIVAVRHFEKSCHKNRPAWLVDSSGDSPRSA